MRQPSNTLLALCLAAAASSLLAGCGQPAAPPAQTDVDDVGDAMAQTQLVSTPDRVVCTSGGKVVYDDFVDNDIATARSDEGFIYYGSRSTGKAALIGGECYAYASEVPSGWKPTFPKPDGETRP